VKRLARFKGVGQLRRNVLEKYTQHYSKPNKIGTYEYYQARVAALVLGLELWVDVEVEMKAAV
jgi:hypothetical protein